MKSKPPARRRRTGWTTCAPSGHGSTSTPVKTETHCETKAPRVRGERAVGEVTRRHNGVDRDMKMLSNRELRKVGRAKSARENQSVRVPAEA